MDVSGAADWFEGLIATEVERLPPTLQRAADLALRSDGEENCVSLAHRLSDLEGQAVTPAAFRQRISRALRRVERGLEAQARHPAMRPGDGETGELEEAGS
jgi:hypothetical protein